MHPTDLSPEDLWLNPVRSIRISTMETLTDLKTDLVVANNNNTLVEKKLQRFPEVCCTWNLYGWQRVCVARDGLNIELLHMGHVLLMLTVSNPCVILKS